MAERRETYMPQWTQRQQQAIEARSCNLLVAAAAGSGKTAVLVERICALVREGMRIDRMLVVTFTRPAAAEMRQKILEAFERIADGEEEQAAYFAEQAALVERAQISTLHVFCATLLRTYFSAVGIDPTFRIGDEKENAPLCEEALRDAVAQAYEANSPEFQALAECWSEEEIQRQVMQVYGFVRTQPEPWIWLNAAAKQYVADTAALEQSAWMEALLSGAQQLIDSALVNFRQALHCCSLPGGCAAYIDSLQNDVAQIEALRSGLPKGYTRLREAAQQIAFRTIGRAPKECDAELKEQAKALREAGKKLIQERLIKKLLEVPIEDHVEDLIAQRPLIEALVELVQTVDEGFSQRKRERNLLDYGDLEHKALEAVRHPWVADAVRAQYDAIFVDEYQDSSMIQEDLISHIAREDNVFLVGDVKQSIYRFRQAEPKLFLSKLEVFSATAETRNRRVDLNQNFRSRPNVLAAINRVFEYAMRKDETEIPYDEEAHLYPGLTLPDEDPPIEFHLLGGLPQDDISGQSSIDIEESTDEEEDERENTEEEESGEAWWDTEIKPGEKLAQEATLAARRVHALVGTPYWDVKKGAYRPLRYRDMVILLRVAKNVAQQVQSIFEGQGIPVYSDAGEAYFMMPEVRMVIDLLRVVDNPLHDHALLAALHGIAGRISNDGLVAIRQACTDPEASYYDAVVLYAQREDALAHRLGEFLTLLTNFRLYAKAQPLEDLIWRVYETTGCYARAGALPGGKARQANLRMLADRAAMFERRGEGGLTAFLWEAEQLRARGDNTSAKALTESEDVVRIMTMHMSKGLEFPVVICLELGRNFHKKGGVTPAVDCHAAQGIAMRRIHPVLRTRYNTLPYEAIKLQRKKEALADATRLLYVAMTRAQHRLILIGHGAPTPQAFQQKIMRWRHAPEGTLLQEAETMMDFIVPSLLRHPDAATLYGEETIQGQGRPPLPDDSRWQVFRQGVIPIEERAMAEVSHWIDQLHADAAAYPPEKQSIAPLLWSPIASSGTKGKLKTTVTALLREGEEASPGHILPQPAPLFLEAQEGASILDGAARGTAFHAAMRALSLPPLRNVTGDVLCAEIETQLDAICRDNRLTEAQRQTIWTEDIASFFVSEIGRQLLASDTVRREWAFNLKIQGDAGMQLVQGVIDCCFLKASGEQRGWCLIDYKTDGDSDANTILKRYTPQIEMYARALVEITKIPIWSASLYLTKKSLFIKII